MNERTEQNDADCTVADRTLDVTGSPCPVPVLKAKAELESMSRGETLEVLATDPLAEVDLAVLCERLGHRLISSSDAGGQVRVRIQRA